jgi:hypothetical protein
VTQGPVEPSGSEADFTDDAAESPPLLGPRVAERFAEPEADFTDEATVPLAPSPGIGDRIAEGRERVRGWLAAALVGLLVLLDAGILILAVLKVRPFDRELIALLMAGVLNPVVALVGTVLGFYFGEKAGKSST